MHFSDFAENTLGGQFDFEHLKDWTMVNMLPLGQPVQFRNMRLLGGPFGCDGYTTRKSPFYTLKNSQLICIAPKTQPPESTTAGPVVTPNVEIKKDTMINTNSAYSDRSFLVGLFAGLLPALYLILA